MAIQTYREIRGRNLLTTANYGYSSLLLALDGQLYPSKAFISTHLASRRALLPPAVRDSVYRA